MPISVYTFRSLQGRILLARLLFRISIREEASMDHEQSRTSARRSSSSSKTSRISSSRYAGISRAKIPRIVAIAAHKTGVRRSHA